MPQFHYSAELALSVPFLVALPLGLVTARPGPGPLFHVFSGPTKLWFYRGQQTGLSRAEYAKLERGALATGLQLQQDGHI